MVDMADTALDGFTRELLDTLFMAGHRDDAFNISDETRTDIRVLFDRAGESSLTAPIIDLFARLKVLRSEEGLSPGAFGIDRETLAQLALKHQRTDEHEVSVGGRVDRALGIVNQANDRVTEYLDRKDVEAPSGIELWPAIQENARRIQKTLGMSEADWGSYSGQIRNCIDSVETLARVIDLPAQVIAEVARVTESYRMRLTPYYASLIQPGRVNDPVLAPVGAHGRDGRQRGRGDPAGGRRPFPRPASSTSSTPGSSPSRRPTCAPCTAPTASGSPTSAKKTRSIPPRPMRRPSTISVKIPASAMS